MPRHDFMLILEGPDVADLDKANALYAAGCGDALFGVTAGVQYGDFTREAPTLSQAVLSAIEQVESSVPGLQVVRVEPDELVTVAEMARRLGRTRESVRLLTEGKRGPGNFPPPVALLGGKQPVWHWSEAAPWFSEYGALDASAVSAAEFIAALNGALDLRRHLSRLDDSASPQDILALVDA